MFLIGQSFMRKEDVAKAHFVAKSQARRAILSLGAKNVMSTCFTSNKNCFEQFHEN